MSGHINYCGHSRHLYYWGRAGHPHYCSVVFRQDRCLLVKWFCWRLLSGIGAVCWCCTFSLSYRLTLKDWGDVNEVWAVGLVMEDGAVGVNEWIRFDISRAQVRSISWMIRDTTQLIDRTLSLKSRVCSKYFLIGWQRRWALPVSHYGVLRHPMMPGKNILCVQLLVPQVSLVSTSQLSGRGHQGQ